MKTALVTGGCSGIGLGLVRHLLAKPDWRVVVADIRAEAYSAISSTLDSERHTFIQTDVGSWDSQAALFKQAYEWCDGQIDFFAANAGTAEKDPITVPTDVDVDGEPVKPPMICTQVNQIGVFYGLRLFIHYTRRTAKKLKAATSTTPFNPKVVITASASSIYPFPVVPEYCATKHAVLGLTRAVGGMLLATDNIAVNCIMPAYVDTGLTPSEVTSLWPKEWITPVSTMIRAYDELTAEDGRVAQDSLSNGVDGQVKTGQAVECVVDKLFYRNPVEYADESERFLIEEGLTTDGVWWRGFKAMAENAAKAEANKNTAKANVAEVEVVNSTV